MNVMMIFHHQLFPSPVQRKYVHRCGCGKFLFEANNENITITNDIGLPWSSYPPGQTVIELMCHSCKSRYKILFQ